VPALDLQGKLIAATHDSRLHDSREYALHSREIKRVHSTEDVVAFLLERKAAERNAPPAEALEGFVADVCGRHVEEVAG
jgi:hypothetical protein